MVIVAAGLWAGFAGSAWIFFGWRRGLFLLVLPALHWLATAWIRRLHTRWTVPEQMEITTPGLRDLPRYPRPANTPATMAGQPPNQTGDR